MESFEEIKRKDQSSLNLLLWDAGKYGHTEIFKLLWPLVTDLNRKEKTVWSACRHGHFFIVDFCISKHAFSVEMALDIASANGKIDLVNQLILKYPVDLQLRFEWELITYSACGTYDTLSTTLKSNEELVSNENIVSRCLTVACYHNHIKVVDWLIDNTFVNLSKTYNLFTVHEEVSPLLAACIKGNKNVIRSLLQYSTAYIINNMHTKEKESTTGSGRRPTKCGRDTALHLVIWCDETPKRLCDACYAGNYEQVQSIIHENESYLNEQDNEGKTPLHIACRHGYESIIKVLLVGADVEMTNDWYETALELAEHAGHGNLQRNYFEQRL